MSSIAPTWETPAALVAELLVVRAEAYALLDALRAANFRLQELIASHDRLEKAGRMQLRSLSPESALDRLKAAIANEPKQWPAWLPLSGEAIADGSPATAWDADQTSAAACRRACVARERVGTYQSPQ
jgi:hypothetical protein